MAIRKEYNQSWNPYWMNMPEADIPVASEETLGGVKVGDGLDINESGVLSSSGSGTYVLPIAGANTLGGVKVGAGLSIDSNGVLTADATSLTEEQVAALKAILNIQ